MSSKFYSILLSEEMHTDLKRLSYETGKHISDLVRNGISQVLRDGEIRKAARTQKITLDE